MIIAVRLTPSRTNSDIEFDYMSRKEREPGRAGREKESKEARRRVRKRGEGVELWGMEFELRARDARSEPIGDEYIRSIFLAIHL